MTYGFHEPPKHFRTCYKLLGCDAAGPFSLHAPVRYELKRAIMQSGKSEAEGGLLVYRSVQDAALREDAAFCTRRRADGVSLVVAKVLAW